MRRMLVAPLVLLLAGCTAPQPDPPVRPQAVPDDFSCPDPRALASSGDLPSGAVAARLCPGTDDAATPNWQPPADRLVTDVAGLAAEVSALPEDHSEMCTADGGPVYLLTFQYADGSLHTVRAALRGCRTIEVGDTVRSGAVESLQGLVSRLEQQRAGRVPPDTEIALDCSYQPEYSYPTLSLVALPQDVTRAVLCARRQPEPDWSGPVPIPTEDLARLVTDLHAEPVSQMGWKCSTDPMIYRVVGQTAWGDRVGVEIWCRHLMALAAPAEGAAFPESSAVVALVERLADGATP